MSRILIMVVGLIFASASQAFTLFGDSQITDHWSQSKQDSQVRVDHTDWDGILERYINPQQGINLFAYGSVTPQDDALLSAYLRSLQQLTVTDLNGSEQFAYWVNLYNALTVRVVLDHYPVQSIKDISYSLTAQGPWSEKLVTVEGYSLSLDEIEHEILRPIFRDNRIHYAVNCASMGCPNLQTDAFTAENLGAMLDSAAQQYINHPRGVLASGDQLVLSSIYNWYQDDFGSTDAEVIEHLMLYAEPRLGSQIEAFSSISDYRYDWAIND